MPQPNAAAWRLLSVCGLITYLKKNEALSSIFYIFFIIITICFATRHRENAVSSSASLAPIQGSGEGVSSQIYRGGGRKGWASTLFDYLQRVNYLKRAADRWWRCWGGGGASARSRGGETTRGLKKYISVQINPTFKGAAH